MPLGPNFKKLEKLSSTSIFEILVYNIILKNFPLALLEHYLQIPYSHRKILKKTHNIEKNKKLKKKEKFEIESKKWKIERKNKNFL